MMKTAESASAFWPKHGGILLFMAFVALVARPLVSTAHDLIKNQIIAGPVSNRVRWLTHRYVLRQSLGFFQNDFAGRVANKVMQAAPALRDSVVQLIDAIWYAAVQWVGAAVIFAAADWRLLIPLLAWLAAYIGALFYFVPRIKERSTEAAEARSMLVGRHGRQLHQHPHRQALRPRRPRGQLRARRARGADGASGRPRCASRRPWSSCSTRSTAS